MKTSSKFKVRSSKFGQRSRSLACRCLLLAAAFSLSLSVLFFTGQLSAAKKAIESEAAPNLELQTQNAKEWREAATGYRFSFPRDYASHPEYKIEWWYYTGNVETKEGRRFGYQLTFFRVGITPAPRSASRWAVRDLFMAHFAITDIERGEFHSFELINRAGIGWAGADAYTYRVWNEGWEARLDAGAHLLRASEDGFEIELRLAPAKPEVIHGVNEISQKGPSEGNASHYYSLTRLATSGRVRLGNETFEVTGQSWMDHEFGTSFLEEQQVGWDWFSIQLDDGRELMLFQIRRRDGSPDPRSSGTLIEPDGRTTHIPFGEFALSPVKSWRSPESGAAYPVRWAIELPRYGLQLNIAAAIDNQELRTAESTGVTYWEGSITVDGLANDASVKGRGYLEMTGYSGQNMGEILR